MNALSPFGWLYGRVTEARNALFNRAALASHSLGAKTISIGNITTGGTGKTPLVEYVADLLAGEGEKVCILTRGYGRENPNQRVLVSDGESILADAATGGDEPVELAYKLLGSTVVVADADRITAAKWAKETFAITAFVLDDAFQHRRANRDLDIVCVDATNPFGNGETLPAGTLREPLAGLDRADVIVITRANLVESTDTLRATILKNAPDAKVFCASLRMSGLTRLQDFHSQKPVSQNQTVETSMEDGSYFAFCGIGNPDNFFKQLRLEGLNVVGTRAYRDHHRYTSDDVRAIESQAKKAGADRLLTTAKDAVKLMSLEFTIDCYVALTESVIDDEMAFRGMILSS